MKLRYLRLFCVFALFIFLQANKANAGVLPDYFYHAAFGPSIPDLSNLQHLRFLTTEDFYPFNYRPAKGTFMTGYNVDLMRAICKELNVLSKCELEPMRFEDLVPNLVKGEGEAILAGLSAETPDLPKGVVFSKPYMLFPARFIAITSRYNATKQTVNGRALQQQHIGVLRDTKHVAMLHSYFPNIVSTEYGTMEELTKALQQNKIDAIFGDGRMLAALDGPYSFEDKPYYNQKYLGSGMRIAVLAKRNDILDAINYALDRLAKNGDLYMIYLRYFPRNFY